MGIPASEYARLIKGKKKNKYSNKHRVKDGIKFHSKKEANRYQELRLLEKAKEISDLKLQVPVQLVAYYKDICIHIADFVYFDDKKASYVIEDAKGVRTAVFNLKWKLLKAQFGDKYIYRIT